MKYATVFGPVRSGRLGLSLGLDMLGAAVCSMDCLYCEVGPTRVLTRERRPWLPAGRILSELAAWRDENAAPDIVTLGGMGEPCLNSDLPEVLAGVRRLMPDVPTAVLTNATLLDDEEVRKGLYGADVVLPSLDSLVEAEYTRINRPAPGITAAGVAQSILEFRRGFSGRIFLEVLLCEGINDSAENLELLGDYVARLRPDRVDVVTLTRSGAYPAARAVPAGTLARFRDALAAASGLGSGTVSGAMAGTGKGRAAASDRQAEAGRSPLTDAGIKEIVRNSLRRRPQTPGQISDALGVPAQRLEGILREMERDGSITCTDGFCALKR